MRLCGVRERCSAGAVVCVSVDLGELFAHECGGCLSQHTRCQQAGGESKRRLLCSFLLRHHFSAPGPTACAGILHPAGRWGTTGRLAQLPCPLASLSLACDAWKNAPASLCEAIGAPGDTHRHQ